MTQPVGGRGISRMIALSKLAESNNENNFGRGRSLQLSNDLDTPGSSRTIPNPSWGRGRTHVDMIQLLKNIDQRDDLSSSHSEKSELSTSTSHKSIMETFTLGRGKPLVRNSIPENNVSEAELSHLKIENLSMKSSENEVTNNKEPVSRLGETGHQVDVITNYIRLTVKPGHGAYEYTVKFNPQTDNKGFCLKMLYEHSENLGKVYNFDGFTLYLPKKLPKNKNVFVSKHPIEKADVDLEITFVKEKPLSEMTHLYNVLFKQIMNDLKFQRIGRHSFDPKASQMIPQHKLQVWPGYVTAVAEYEDGLMLNLDPMHRVLRTQSVLSELKEISARTNNKSHDSIRNAIIGRAVITHYNCKLYIVDDIDFSNNPLSEFEQNDGKRITFYDYYKTNHDQNILDLDQPLLISRYRSNVHGKEIEKLICLVPELCNLTGLSEEMKNDFRLMKDLAVYTRITPNQRYSAMKEYIKNVNSNPKAVERLDKWGLSLAQLPVKLTARTLPPEAVHFGNNKIIKGSSNANWIKETTIYPVITPVDIENWVVLYTQRDAHNTKDLCECIVRCGQPMGIVIKQPQLIKLNSDKIDDYVKALRSHINKDLQLIVCICPSNRDDRYSAIKRVCCIENPIPSQVINGFTISKPGKLRSISQRVLLQINCKLGGTLWSVPIPFKKAMVVGMDVFHSAFQNVKSVCGFVASYDPLITRWYSRVCFQRSGQEIIDEVKQCFLDALKLYINKNGFFPDRIIVYRDGVGDGQLNLCKNYEVKQLESCFELLDPSYKPTLTFIVVQKRNNTRIFADNRSELGNPFPGTVLDHTITRKYLYDFYVVSQKISEGTIVPTHYVVVYDSSTMSPDHVQRFTYKMCHLYFNWPGTVRVPAPCQYAHKLAFLVGSSLRKEHDHILADRLFFL